MSEPVALAFLDVDTQHDFMEPTGALYVPGAEGITGNLERLLRLAERRGIPVIATVDAHTPDDPEFEHWPSHCVKGTDGQKKIPVTRPHRATVIENRPAELGELERCVILEKAGYSVFQNPNADEILERIGAKRYVVFGVATEVCVCAAVLGLLERGREVLLVEDAIRGVEEQAAQKAIAQMEAAGAKRTTTAAVEALLR